MRFDFEILRFRSLSLFHAAVGRGGGSILRFWEGVILGFRLPGLHGLNGLQIE